jgi:RHS repeat-associated protein
LASVAETQYDAGAINSTLASGSSYPGLDLFGRIINLPWMQSSTVLAELNYGYDQASNRLYRQDAKAAANFDELYSYDAMHRLQSAARGTLTSGVPPITNPTLQQGWHLDATGNWVNFNNFDLVMASNTLMQQRASNAANEITGIAATVGSAWQTPAYDRNGNMTTIPEPLALASGYTGIWDAWNRLIYLQSGDENVEFCLYDGLNRRIMRNQYSGGDLTEQRFFIHSDQWQVLEEYVAATSLTVPAVQWVWGQRYIDDCVLRDSNSSGTLNLRLYALQDANWNVVALYNPASGGSIVERYAYTPYGVVLFLDNGFDPLSDNVSNYSWETLYCGYRYDAARGMCLARFRWLNPPLGCWLSRDPAGYNGGDFDVSRYVRSSPVSFADPAGLLVPIGVAGGAAATGAGASVAVAAGIVVAAPVTWYGGYKVGQWGWGKFFGWWYSDPALLKPLDPLPSTATATDTAIDTAIDTLDTAECRRRRCYCSTKARNWSVGTPCYNAIFEAVANSCNAAKAESWQACVDAGCHKPGNGGDCGHNTCNWIS